MLELSSAWTVRGNEPGRDRVFSSASEAVVFAATGGRTSGWAEKTQRDKDHPRLDHLAEVGEHGRMTRLGRESVTPMCYREVGARRHGGF